MVRKKLYNRLLVLGVVSSITISSGLIAFAQNTNIANSPKSKIEGKLDISRKGGAFNGDIQKGVMIKSNFLADVLSTEVKAGVITQAEADKVTAFLKTKEDARKAEVDAEKAKLDAMTDTEKKAAMEAKKVERDAERAKLQAMTSEERTAYMKANNINIFTELVTAGILTQDQADKIQAAVPARFDKGQEQRNQQGQGSKIGNHSGNFLETALTTEVKAGVITQAEADKVTAFLKTKEAARKAEVDAEKAKLDAMTDAERKVAMEAKKVERDAERAKIQAMTAEERTAYMKANRPNILTELVTAGILTQDKADKLQAAVPEKFKKGRQQSRIQGQTPVEAKTNSL